MNQECPSDAQLGSFLEGALTADEAETVDAHLSACSRCQSVLDAMTDSHLGSDLAEVASEPDPAVSRLVSRLSALDPETCDSEDVTSSGITFPGPPSEEAPLGELGVYQIREHIGDGTSGLLYRAVDPRIDREVAIKVLRSELAGRDESRQRLNREARAVAGLTHENVVTLYEFGNMPGFPPYLVMEYIAGESLSQRLRRDRPLPAQEAVAIVLSVARALAVAHEQNLVHRDVKASNILLEADGGRPKLTDFGLALLDDGNTDLTREGSLAGTPAYISPEQILDPHNVDGRSDVYSLGIVLYQLLTGELPFQGVIRMTLLAVLHQEPRSPRQLNDEIPRDLETICLTAMAKDRTRRYQTAADLADDLQRWAEGHPVHARPVGRTERFFRWCRRNPRLAALSTAVVGLLLTVTVGSVVASISLSRAREKAQNAATLASEQRDQAFATLNRLVYEVNEQFEDSVTNLDEIQKTVLDVSVEGLSEMARTADNAGLTDVSTAAAHVRLGLVLTRLERYDEAREHFNRGDELLRRLGGEQSGEWSVVRHMIESRWFRSDLALDQEDYGEATRHLEEAVMVADAALKKWPDTFDSRFTFAQSVSRLADHYFAEDDERIETTVARALDAFERLRSDYPDDDRVLNEATNSLDTLAAHYYNNEQIEKAVKSYGELIARCEQVLDQDPTQSDYAEWLILAHHVMSDICQLQKNNEQAIDHLTSAMSVADRFEHWLPFEVIQAIQRELDTLKE